MKIPLKQVDIDSVFANRSEWPPNSATFFLREHENPWDGKRGLVYKSHVHKGQFSGFIDDNGVSGFSDLGDEELHYHLHTTGIHYGVTHAVSNDICEMSRHMVQQCQQEKNTALEAATAAFNNTLLNTLGNLQDKVGSSELQSRVRYLNFVCIFGG